MLHLVRPPRSAVLRPFVDSLEYVEDDPRHERERLMPSASGVMLLITLYDNGFATYDPATGAVSDQVSAAVLVGPASRPALISTRPQRGMVAVNFSRGGVRPFVPGPVSALRDSYVPIGEMWGRAGDVLREQTLGVAMPESKLDILESALLKQFDSAAGRDLAVDRAITALDRGAPVGRVIEDFGTTAKPFIRRFSDQTGLTPKRFSRVRRLQHLLAGIATSDRPDWAFLATEHGYFDQAHLIHDFHDLTGLRPTDYRPRGRNEWNHVVE